MAKTLLLDPTNFLLMDNYSKFQFSSTEFYVGLEKLPSSLLLAEVWEPSGSSWMSIISPTIHQISKPTTVEVLFSLDLTGRWARTIRFPQGSTSTVFLNSSEPSPLGLETTISKTATTSPSKSASSPAFSSPLPSNPLPLIRGRFLSSSFQ